MWKINFSSGSRGFTEEPELQVLELPDTLEQLYRQYSIHTAAISADAFSAVTLCSIDDVHLSVLQNLILVCSAVLLFCTSFCIINYKAACTVYFRQSVNAVNKFTLILLFLYFDSSLSLLLVSTCIL